MTTRASAAPPLAKNEPAAPRYAETFERLLAHIERAHVFAPSFERVVGHAWRDDVSLLRDEFLQASNRTEALIALRHLANSLRDAHCRPDPPVDLTRAQLSLGVRLWAGGSTAEPDVRVERVLDAELTGRVDVGDRLVAVDEVPLDAWLAANRFEARALEPLTALEETVRAIVVAPLPFSRVRDGDRRVLRFEHGGAPIDVMLAFRRSWPRSQPAPSLDAPPPLASVTCDADRPIDYGNYDLAAIGVNLCVYQPTDRRRLRVPVVRYLSFLYEGNREDAYALRQVKIDHDLLLRELAGADGVVLDLHENHGGNNPHLFLGWFAPAPWRRFDVVTRVLPGLDEELPRVLFGDERLMARYRAAQQNGVATLTSSFLCPADNCEQEVARPAELATRAPVAVITGPECVSSCDTFALSWSHFGLGPLLGKQPMHGYTVHRLPLQVLGPEHEDLGTFRVALSHAELEAGVSLEGEPLRFDWEAQHTFDTRESWVRLAVEEAVALLSAKPQ